MTETLAAFLLAGSLASLAGPKPWAPVLGGLGLGLAGLCRPSTLACAGLVALAALVAGPGGGRERLRRAVGLVVAMGAVLAPWAWRNERTLGEPVWTTTHGGYTLALANNPAYYDDVLHGPPGAVWSGPNQRRWFEQIGRETAGMTEPEADRYLRAAALRMVAARPGDFLRAALARLGRFWGVAPSGAVYPAWLRLLTALFTLPLWLALAAGLLRPSLWRWPRVAAPAMILGLSAVHALFWTDLRMRAPIVPSIAAIAASAPRGWPGALKTGRKNGK
ncbi:MAG: hypothetical protein IRY99_27030 [Isosphaeraceae bacterium]|nr:hypothetical protein [Isosphaeraceae bacterium]